jgi:hypothetical protein
MLNDPDARPNSVSRAFLQRHGAGGDLQRAQSVDSGI